MTEKQVAAGGGVGSATLITLLLIALKAAGLIDWSWPMVFVFFWGPVAAVVGIALLAAAVLGVVVVAALTYERFVERRSGR